MIKKQVRQMLTAQILSALTVSLCLLIDNIMIGRFLGERALTAYGLANPMLLVIGAVGSMLCAGAQVACSKSLGRGDREETDVGFSSTVAAGLLFSGAFMVLALLLRTPSARMLGADDPALLDDTSRYIAGFSIGALASVGALMLVPFLQLAGREFAPVYPIFDGEYDSGDDWFKGQTLKMYRTLEVTNEPLPAGTYYIEYVIYDMFMRPMFLDWARMDWDGQTATFPDADSWQGEVELKVADSYW